MPMQYPFRSCDVICSCYCSMDSLMCVPMHPKHKNV